MKKLLNVCILGFFFGASLIFAQDGPALAGFYKLGEPAEVGQDVQLTITARIGNYGELPISGGIILLVDSNLPETVLGFFPGRLDAGTGEMKRFEGEFTVPQLLYEGWQRDQKPCLRVSYINPEGLEVLSPVLLSRNWIDEER